jgi:hypothetical protein
LQGQVPKQPIGWGAPGDAVRFRVACKCPAGRSKLLVGTANVEQPAAGRRVDWPLTPDWPES